MCTRLDFSSAFHPQIDRQLVITIKILEVMLRASTSRVTWMILCYSPTSHITIASKLILAWLFVRPCMVDRVGHHCVRPRQGKPPY